MLGGVFISYRREDVSGFARAMDCIAQRLERKNVFFDVDNIEPGVARVGFRAPTRTTGVVSMIPMI
jgi:hypothetical protein